MGALVLQSASEFTTEIANQTLADWAGEAITNVDVSPLGEGVGLMSSIARADLTLASGAHRSVIVKVIAQTENVGISKELNFYSNEVNFYRYLAASCPVPVPACLFADIDADTQDFLLILEDMGDAAAGDQIAGCDEALMAQAFFRAGQLHGRYWDKTEQFDWLRYQNVPALNQFRRDAIFIPGVKPTIEMFPHHFRGNLAEVVEKIGDQFVQIFERAMSGPQTVIHGDYRIDNMLLPERDGQVEIVAVDWQNTTGGKGPHDLAYFASQSCEPAVRRAKEMSALRDYHQILLDEGAKNYSFDQCLEDYRLNLLITMITPIAICGTLDAGNDRGMSLGEVILVRSLDALEVMECADLLA